MSGLNSLQQGFAGLSGVVQDILNRRQGPATYPERSGENPTQAILPPDYDSTDYTEYAKGGRLPRRRFASGGPPEEPAPRPRAVLKRRPMAMPVLHTTIVISPKKKPTAVKKKKGGPLKPAAVPPTRGPESQGPPAPFRKGGHVQVPRGSGIASKGKRFSGIY
jgi:hypothetical protein